MAKRQRGGTRPGQRAPLQRGGHPAAKAPAKPAPSPAPRPAGGLTDDELARAAELEARLVAEDRAASATARGRRRPAGDAVVPARSRAVGSLAAVADEEYRYVTRDLRRIAVVFTAIFALLIGSWLLIAVSGLVTI